MSTPPPLTRGAEHRKILAILTVCITRHSVAQFGRGGFQRAICILRRSVARR